MGLQHKDQISIHKLNIMHFQKHYSDLSMYTGVILYNSSLVITYTSIFAKNEF